jgi:hypothetical protein
MILKKKYDENPEYDELDGIDIMKTIYDETAKKFVVTRNGVIDDDYVYVVNKIDRSDRIVRKDDPN